MSAAYPEDQLHEGKGSAESCGSTKQECWERIQAAPYGRIAAAAANDEIDIFPVNHAVLEDSIVFRTSPGTKLLELTIRERVAFEVDGRGAGETYSVEPAHRTTQRESGR